jgi:hypothetical protein
MGKPRHCRSYHIDVVIAATIETMMAPLVGIWGQPYVKLDEVLGTTSLAMVDDEITMGLCTLEPGQTGGGLKSMGVTAPWVEHDGAIDYGHVIARFTLEQWRTLVSLSDDPSEFDEDDWQHTQFGDETDHPLNNRQIRYLSYAHGVYFPWQVCVHLLENDRWEDKHDGEGKQFTAVAQQLFPRTIEYLRSLPFEHIGRVVLFGLLPYQHAPAHRDSEPGQSLSVAQSLSICPRGDKRFYLTDPDREREVIVDSKLYWFNDMDYHGVHPDPFFRYSIRIDGKYRPSFLRDLQQLQRVAQR